MIRILPVLFLVAAVMACSPVHNYACTCPILCDSLLGEYWYPETGVPAESAREAEAWANEQCQPHAEDYCVDSVPSCDCYCAIPN